MTLEKLDSPTRDRIVHLAGGHNFRDIGGYATQDGRTVRWGKVFRSGTLAELGREAHAVLDALGLTVVCDLRTSSERERRPSRFAEGHSFDIWARDYEMSGADLAREAQAAGVSPDRMRARMVELYATLPHEQAPGYRELFRRLADGPLPLLFHCSAGKDRTGVAAALLLDMLGVARRDILEDYALTDRFFERGCALVRNDPIGDRLRAVDPAIWAPMMRADPAYLQAMFVALDERHGSARAFLRDVIGVDTAREAAIRDRLLD